MTKATKGSKQKNTTKAKEVDMDVDDDESTYDEGNNASIYDYIDKKMKSTEETIIKFIEMNNRLLDARLDNVIKDVAEVKYSLNFCNDLLDKKMNDITNTIQVIKNEKHTVENNQILENSNNYDLKLIKDKLTDLENRSRRNNLRFDGIPEDKDEDWKVSEAKIKKLLNEKLGMDEDIEIDRAHRSGKIERNGKNRVIIARFTNYKTKEVILKNSNKLKDTGFYINEDFAEETQKLRASLVPEMKRMRAEGKFAIIKFDKLIVKEWVKKD